MTWIITQKNNINLVFISYDIKYNIFIINNNNNNNSNNKIYILICIKCIKMIKLFNR